MTADRNRVKRALLFLCSLALVAGLLSGIGSPPVIAQELITGKGSVYAGMYSDASGVTGVTDEMNALAGWAGRRATFVGSFHDVGENQTAVYWDPGKWSNTVWLLDQAWNAQATPFVNVNVFQATAQDIAEGDHDAYIEGWATHVKAWLDKGGNRSLMIAPLQEMNGNWVPYGMDPGNFKIVYNKFRDTFRGMGMDETKVRWAFAPNGWSTPGYRIADYYPGDGVVDVIGISAYNFGSCYATWSSVYQTMGGALDELRSTVSPSKPYFIAQTGSSSCGGDKDAWLREMFGFLANDQNVVGFVYFNIDKETDWKVFHGTWGSQGFQDGMRFAGTDYDWPLTNWFQPGPLPFQAYSPPFWDDDGSVHEADIVAIYNDGVTNGCNAAGDMYCPLSYVTRGQMAAFLERAQGLPASGTNHFVDDEGHLFEPDINALADQGTTKGCNVTGDLYCPEGHVTRGQMAAFIVRALGLPAASQDYFWDDNGNQFEAEINALRQADITRGCHTSDRFCPDEPVTREQMASFLARAFLYP